MADRILAVVDDLFFMAKIQQTARQLNVGLKTVAPGAVASTLAAGGTSAILLDLNHRSGAALNVLKTLKGDARTSGIPVVGFLSHVQADLAKAARAAGCDVVLARSAFSQQLPSLLIKLSGEDTSAPPQP